MPKKKNTKRSDGRIAVQVYLGKDENGKRKYKTVYGSTQKEADEKAREIKTRLGKGLDISAADDSFCVWCERWLASKKRDIGNSQYLSYVGYTNHLKSALNGMPLKDIKLYNIQSVIDDLYEYNPNTGSPSSKKTLTDIKNTAVQIFDFAIDNRVIDYNPAKSVKIPKNAEKKTRRALTPDEQTYIRNTQHRMQTAAMIMLYAGLRRGEVIPLLWSDVNLKNKTITVNKAVDLSDGKPVVKSTKTKSGKRVVVIPSVLSDYLALCKKENILVCPSLNGEMYTATSWKTSWNSYLYDLDILYGKLPQKKSKYDNRFPGITMSRITPHMLRHTFCTNMYLAGVDILTAQHQMGHADIKTTLSIYTHISDDFAKDEMNKMDEYYNNASHMQVRHG